MIYKIQKKRQTGEKKSNRESVIFSVALESGGQIQPTCSLKLMNGMPDVKWTITDVSNQLWKWAQLKNTLTFKALLSVSREWAPCEESIVCSFHGGFGNIKQNWGECEPLWKVTGGWTDKALVSEACTYFWMVFFSASLPCYFSFSSLSTLLYSYTL